MTAMKESTRAGLMLTHGLAMVALGFGLLWIRATMSTWLFQLLGCAFALLLVAGSLLLIAVSDLICVIGARSRAMPGLRRLLIASLLAAAAAAFLIFYPGVTIGTVGYITAVYALLLSVAKFHLARHWGNTRQGKAVMYLLAGIALVFAGVMAAVAALSTDDRDVLTLIAAYSFYMGVQILLTRHYLHVQPVRATV